MTRLLRVVTNAYYFGGAGHIPLGKVHLDADGFYVMNSTSTKRDTGFTGIATSHRDSNVAGGTVQVSYPLMGGDVTPFASLDYATYDRDAITEAGGGLLDFPEAKTNKSSLQADFGVRLMQCPIASPERGRDVQCPASPHVELKSTWVSPGRANNG